MDSLKDKIKKGKEKIQESRVSGGSLGDIQDAIKDIYDRLEDLEKK